MNADAGRTLECLLIDLERLAARMDRVSPECADMVMYVWREYSGEGE